MKRMKHNRNDFQIKLKRIRTAIKEIVSKICMPISCIVRKLRTQKRASVTTQVQVENHIPKPVTTNSLFTDESSRDMMQDLVRIPVDAVALGCMDQHCFLRRICINIVDSVWFEKFIMFLILISSVLLCLDEATLDPNSGLKRFLYFSKGLGDYRVIYSRNDHQNHSNGSHRAQRLLSTQRMETNGLQLFHCNRFNGLEFIRGFGALRPLRMISRFENMKVVGCEQYICNHSSAR
eukprot:976863_1